VTKKTLNGTKSKQTPPASPLLFRSKIKKHLRSR